MTTWGYRILADRQNLVDKRERSILKTDKKTTCGKDTGTVKTSCLKTQTKITVEFTTEYLWTSILISRVANYTSEKNYFLGTR